MTTRQKMLLLRYCASLIANETLAWETRRALREAGLDDAAIDAAVARVKASVEETQ